ncbi:MAG: hypothetical protein PWP35_47 [Bacteroidales bacterium]|nr:hypothetical protein [Bacteroidales bacterium]
MKKRLLKFAGILLLVMVGSAVFAQDPPPPPSGGHGQSGNQTPGGSAPIGNGLFILSALAAAYGSYKIYRWKFQSFKKDEQ